MTKLKESNCDKTQKVKLWQNSKTQTVTQLQVWQNLETQNVKKFYNSNFDKTHIVVKLKTFIATKLWILTSNKALKN